MIKIEDFNDLKSESIIDRYKKNYGQIKLDKISKDILTAKRSAQLIANSIAQRTIPNGDTFVECVTANWKYVFASADKIEVASMLLFVLWLDAATKEQHLDLNIEDLAKIESRILKRCNEMRFK